MSCLGAIAAAMLGLGEGSKLSLKSLELRGWAVICATALCLGLPGAVARSGNSAKAGGALEEGKLPMRFGWVECQPNCKGWVSAVGIVTADSPRDFDEFARGRDLAGATVVLDSSGGSVNDSMTLGRRLRGDRGVRATVMPEAYCESMCVFLLLAGKTRYVPDAAHIRVHQIWMGDRADDAKAASYNAQDLMIVERDIGRLAKFTFDMGGTGDLLLLALNVPPWEDLHELSSAELRLTHLVTTDAVAEVLPLTRIPVAEAGAKPVQDRFVSKAEDTSPQPAKATKTAEALVPTGA